MGWATPITWILRPFGAGGMIVVFCHINLIDGLNPSLGYCAPSGLAV